MVNTGTTTTGTPEPIAPLIIPAMAKVSSAIITASFLEQASWAIPAMGEALRAYLST
jgi:hypothetical protein